VQPSQRPQVPPFPDLALLGVLALGLGLRLGWILLVPNEQFSDFKWYDEAARHLAAHGELRYDTEYGIYRAWFPPGWPFFLSLFYRLVGPVPDLVKAVNLVLAVVTILLTVRIGTRLWGRRAGLWGGGFLAALPGQVAYVSTSNYEVFLAALVTAALTLLLETDWAAASSRSGRLHALGVLLAWMAMTRPLLVLLPLVAAWYLRTVTKPRHALVLGAVLAAYVGAASLGWMTRNLAVLGEPVLFSTNGGYNFWHGNHPNATGRAMQPPNVPDPRLNPHTLRNEVSINRAGYRYGLEYVREQPLRFIAMIPTRIYYLYYTDTMGVYLSFLRAPMKAPTPLEPLRSSPLPEQIAFRSYLLVMLLALAGIALSRARLPGERLLLAFVLYSTFWTAITFGQDRYHVPLMPIFCAFAGLAASRVSMRQR